MAMPFPSLLYCVCAHASECGMHNLRYNPHFNFTVGAFKYIF